MTADVRHLRAFAAIARELNITRAAARLHVTQPALSRTLAQLERHLGVRLVDRSTHHLALTPAGHDFLDTALAALTAVDIALDPARTTARALRLGHSWSALGEQTTALLRRWHDTHPGVALELLRIDDRSAGLADGRVDVAVLRRPLTLPGVRVEPLRTEPRVAAVPADSPLAGRAALTLADLTAYPVAVNTVSGSTTLALWPVGPRPLGTIDTANTDDWLATISAGHAVGVTSDATAATHPHPAVAFVPLTDAPPLQVLLAWRDPPAHPALPALLDLLRSVG